MQTTAEKRWPLSRVMAALDLLRQLVVSATPGGGRQPVFRHPSDQIIFNNQ